ncbi:MAG: XylR N-terminal domain-containing protein [Candidatus Bathyarchaeia archaeon]
MSFTDLTLRLQNLTRDEMRGLILEDNKRILSFSVSTFQALVSRLVDVAGSRVAQLILYELGDEIGWTAARHSKRKMMPNNLVDAFDAALRMRGWGRCLSLEEKEANIFVSTHSDCPLCHRRKAAEPFCDLMRGVVAGWMEGVLNKKAAGSVERRCSAVEGKFCVFEVSFND